MTCGTRSGKKTDAVRILFMSIAWQRPQGYCIAVFFNLQDNQQDKRRNPFYPSLRYGLAPHAILELPRRIPPVDARSADTVRENNPCVASTYAGRARRMFRRFDAFRRAAVPRAYAPRRRVLRAAVPTPDRKSVV